MSRATLATVLFAAGLSWTAGNVGPVVTDIEREFDVTLSQIGVLTGTVYFGAIVVITLAAPWLSHRLGLLDTVRLACVLGTAGNLIFALSPAYAGLVAGQILQGLGTGICLVVGPVFARTNGGIRLLGIYGAAISLGIATALALCSALQDLGVDWRVGFFISAVISASALPIFPRHAKAEEEGGGEEAKLGEFLARAARSPEIWRLLLLFTASLGVPLVVSVWIVHLLATAGMQTWLAGGLGFVLFGISVVARPGGGRLLRAGAPRWVMLGATPLLAAAGLALIAVEPSLAGAFPAVILMGLGFSLPYAAMFDTAERLFPAHRTATVALLTLGPNASPILVMPLVGRALDTGDGEGAFLALGAFVLLAGLANLAVSTRSQDMNTRTGD